MRNSCAQFGVIEQFDRRGCKARSVIADQDIDTVNHWNSLTADCRRNSRYTLRHGIQELDANSASDTKRHEHDAATDGAVQVRDVPQELHAGDGKTRLGCFGPRSNDLKNGSGGLLPDLWPDLAGQPL